MSLKAVLDLRGCIINSYFSSEDPEPISEGINSAEYGLSIFLEKVYGPILEVCEAPLNIIAVLDRGNDYRRGLWPDYKSRRKPALPEVEEQLKILQKWVSEFLVATGATLAYCDGEEADDVIAYLTTRKHPDDVYIVYTIDNDLVALSNENVHVFVNMEEKTEYKGVPARFVTLYKSLIGDSSDGYPGVKGFGPAAFTKMVDAFGWDGISQLDQLISEGNQRALVALLPKVNDNPLAKAIQDYSNWRLMYRLAKLAPERMERIVDKAIHKPVFVFRMPDKAKILAILSAAKCSYFEGNYLEYGYTQELVTEDKLDDFLQALPERINDSPFVAWDYETYDPVKVPEFREAVGDDDFIDMFNHRIAGCSFAFGSNCQKVFYLPVVHADTANVPLTIIEQILKLLKAADKAMPAQNIYFEAVITQVNMGFMPHSWEDTKLYAHHLDEEGETGLKALSKRYMNYVQTTYDELLGQYSAADMSQITGIQVLDYGCDDSAVTARLYNHFRLLSAHEGTRDFIEQYECPAVEALAMAYIDGIHGDPEIIKAGLSEDKEIVETTFARIRRTLAEHCQAPNMEALLRLYEDQKEYVACKARRDSKPEKEALLNYKQALGECCTYIEPGEKVSFKEFLPTLTGLNKVAEKLGLQEIAGLSTNKLGSWIVANSDTAFAQLLGQAAHLLKKREGAAYSSLVNYCSTILIDELRKVEPYGTQLNLDSPKQKQAALYLMLALPIRLRTEAKIGTFRDLYNLPGSPSTDEDAILFALANDCAEENTWKKQVLEDILAYSQSRTRIGDFWEKYRLWLQGGKGVFHPGFSSCGTVTKRPTGNKPNMLQVPKDNEPAAYKQRKIAVRRIFVPRSLNHVIASIDFRSQELVALAGHSKDERMLQAYPIDGSKPKDLHAITGSGVVRHFLKDFSGNAGEIVWDGKVVDYDFMLSKMKEDSELGRLLALCRRFGKTANFTMANSGGAFTISRKLCIPLEAAKLIEAATQETYPGIDKWKKECILFARLHGYVATTYGSRRHCLPNILSANNRIRTRMERQLVNTFMQGQCADLLKVVLTGYTQQKLRERFDARLCFPVYDEVVMDVAKEHLYEFLHVMADLMEVYMPGLDVLMEADCSFGPDWSRQIEVGVRPTYEKIQAALDKCKQLEEL